jgi:glycerophosphoryl diester phosphodiesterase
LLTILFVSLTVALASAAPASAAPGGCHAGGGSARAPEGREVPRRKPIIIAHRGASAERPEHTLAAYRLAIVQGADFIEPDLVLTRDGYLIASHENELGSTTNVADVAAFADRRTTKRVDGVAVTGWFSEDFTLEEIRRLRARERIPALRPSNAARNDEEGIPTLEQIIALVREMERAGYGPVGIYPETKHPTWFEHEGRHLDGEPIAQSITARLVETLVAQRFTAPDRVYIQSFEFANLIALAEELMPAAGIDLPLIQLYGDLEDAHAPGESSFSRPRDIVFHARTGRDMRAVYGGLVDCVPGGLGASTHYGDLATAAVLGHIAHRYAAGIGPWKASLLPRAAPAEGEGGPPVLTGAVHPMLGAALAAGLEVHPYTLRPESAFLARLPDGRVQSMGEEALQLLRLGVTGLFTDAPALGVAARERFGEAAGGRDEAP